MAETDAYATVAEYRARVDKASGHSDIEIESQLSAMSRFIDHLTQRHFTIDDAVTTRLYDGTGTAALRLPDDIATTTGLVVAVDLDADYAHEQELTLNTHYWLDAPRAAFGSEPFPWARLQLIPSNGVASIWPNQRRVVSVTAKFGWASVPAAIKEATVALTRQLRDIQTSGLTLTLENLDEQIRVSPQSSRIIDNLIRVYKRKDAVGYFQ